MRLIDADALLEGIGEEPMNWTNSPEEIQECIDWKQTVATINSAPTIEAELVRHGRWKKISPAGIYECSNCKQDVMTSDICVYNYCHMCGCKMDEVSE